MAMATGEAPVAEVAATELPEIVKSAQEAVGFYLFSSLNYKLKIYFQ